MEANGRRFESSHPNQLPHRLVGKPLGSDPSVPGSNPGEVAISIERIDMLFQTRYAAYGTSTISADTEEEAREFAKERGIGETIVGPESGNKVPIRNIRAFLSSRTIHISQKLHTVSWVGYLGISCGLLTVRDVLGDEGIVHQLTHFMEGKWSNETYQTFFGDEDHYMYARMIDETVACADLIPGFVFDPYPHRNTNALS